MDLRGKIDLRPLIDWGFRVPEPDRRILNELKKKNCLKKQKCEWHELGHRNYRKRELYSVEWRDHSGVELDLNLFVVRGCQFGGPIAIVEDENKVPRTQEFFLRIFTPSGKLLSSVPWRVSGRLAGLGWTNDEHLVAVLSTAEVKVCLLRHVFFFSFANFHFCDFCLLIAAV